MIEDGAYHLGQGDVGQDGQEDDHAGRDEVAHGAVVQLGATCTEERTDGVGSAQEMEQVDL